MIKKIDLHTHSTASDGTFTPSEVAHKAHKTGLSAIALTDHDTINGLAEFKRACGEYGIEGISGVEISARYEKEMHIVGLFIDENDTELAEKLDELKNAREVRNKKVLELVNGQGMEISEYRQSTYCPCYGEEGICCVSRRGIQKVSRQGYELLCSAKNVFA